MAYPDPFAGLPGLKPVSTPGLVRIQTGSGGSSLTAEAPTYYGNPKPKKISSIYGSSSGGAAPPVYAPKLNVAAINAQARKAAAKAVNPFYTKQLKDFLAQQAYNLNQQKAQYQTNVKNLEDQLAQTLEQNAITGERTAEDVAENEYQIAENVEQFQEETGQQFDQGRLEQARNVSTGGLGQQQVQAAQESRNIQEGRQTVQFKQAREQQQQFKSRTFADLARSGKLAGEAKVKGAKQAKFDLDSYIKNSKFQEKATRNQLEEQRLQRIGQETSNQAKLKFNKYLAGIADPAQYEAAMRTYGGAF